MPCLSAFLVLQAPKASVCRFVCGQKFIAADFRSVLRDVGDIGVLGVAIRLRMSLLLELRGKNSLCLLGHGGCGTVDVRDA